MLPLLVALKTWGDEHINPGAETVRITDRESGEEVRLEFQTEAAKRCSPTSSSPRRSHLQAWPVSPRDQADDHPPYVEGVRAAEL